MSYFKQKHKDYLVKNEIKDLTDLANYIELLKTTKDLKEDDRQMLFDFAWLMINDELSLKSFLRKIKIQAKDFMTHLTNLKQKKKNQALCF